MRKPKPDTQTGEFKETQAAFNDDLHRAVHDVWHKKMEIQKAKEEFDILCGKVGIELKKAKKDFIRVQIDGIYVEVEIKPIDEKLVVKSVQ